MKCFGLMWVPLFVIGELLRSFFLWRFQGPDHLLLTFFYNHYIKEKTFSPLGQWCIQGEKKIITVRVRNAAGVLLEFPRLDPFTLPCVCVCVCVCVCARVPSVMSDSVTPWTADHQAPLSMEFSRQEYWNGLPFPTPEDLPVVGIKLVSLMSPALAGGFFITCTTWEAPHCALCPKQNFATTFYLEMMAQHSVPYATVSRLLLISISSARQPLCHLHQSGWRPGDSGRIYMV